MASRDPNLLNRGQEYAQPGRATCPYCSQPLHQLAATAPPPSGVRALGEPDQAHAHGGLRSVCQRCRITFEADTDAFGISDDDRRRVLLAGYRARRAHDRFRADHHEERFRAVSELAEAFVGLHGAPGVRPFTASALHDWALSARLDEGTRAAVAFILHVADAGVRWELRFDVMSAMKRWDTAQRAVFVEWARRPWWA